LATKAHSKEKLKDCFLPCWTATIAWPRSIGQHSAGAELPRPMGQREIGSPRFNLVPIVL